jgi:hypothetical protein
MIVCYFDIIFHKDEVKMKVILKKSEKSRNLEDDRWNSTCEVKHGVDLEIFIQQFISTYYNQPIQGVISSTTLASIEHCYYSSHGGYGRVGLDPNGNGGVSDEGLTLYLMMNDLCDSIGIDLSLEPDEELVLDTVHDLFVLMYAALKKVGVLNDKT